MFYCLLAQDDKSHILHGVLFAISLCLYIHSKLQPVDFRCISNPIAFINTCSVIHISCKFCNFWLNVPQSCLVGPSEEHKCIVERREVRQQQRIIRGTIKIKYTLIITATVESWFGTKSRLLFTKPRARSQAPKSFIRNSAKSLSKQFKLLKRSLSAMLLLSFLTLRPIVDGLRHLLIIIA